MQAFTIRDKQDKPLAHATIDMITGEILVLWVLPEYRRQGRGTYIIKEIELFARSHGLKRIFATALLTNKPTQKLFTKLGYTKLLKYEKIL